MWKRVHPRSRKSGAWFYNVELEAARFDADRHGHERAARVHAAGRAVGCAVRNDLRAVRASRSSTRRALGDVGDFFFADWSRYKVITKGGLQSPTSRSTSASRTNERTFRWITRINGAPKDKSAITPFKATDSSLKLSPFVTLAAR
jgi:hypothetical protein